MASALYEFMPYGAPDLIDGSSRRMARATLWSEVAWVAAFLAALAWWTIRPPARPFERTIVVQYRQLAAPPPLTEVTPPPQVAVAPTAVAPAAAIPVPVPQAEAPPEQTIASQQEIATATGPGEGSAAPGEVIVAEPPPAEALPKLNDFVYTDELPVLITDVAPKYPPIAREAQAEGEVLLRVLVGKDGRVLEVHVDRSLPMFDAAAVEAARQWVFKPALTQNRPVAVWVVRRVRFHLQS